MSRGSHRKNGLRRTSACLSKGCATTERISSGSRKRCDFLKNCNLSFVTTAGCSSFRITRKLSISLDPHTGPNAVPCVRQLPHRSVCETVRFYYSWKRTVMYDDWIRRGGTYQGVERRKHQFEPGREVERFDDEFQWSK